MSRKLSSVRSSWRAHHSLAQVFRDVALADVGRELAKDKRDQGKRVVKIRPLSPPPLGPVRNRDGSQPNVIESSVYDVNGHPGDSDSTTDANGDGLADDLMVVIPAVGAAGGPPLPGFLECVFGP